MFKLFICEITLSEYYLNIKFECNCSISFSYGNTLIGHGACKDFDHKLLLEEGFHKFYENNNSH